MATNRDVVLTLKVRDAEVIKAEGSIRRLKAASDDLNKGGTSFGGKKASEDAEQQKRLAAFMGRDLPQSAKTAADALSKVDEATAAVTGSMGDATAGVSSFASKLGPVGVAIAAVVLVITGAILAFAELAKAAATYGAELDKSMRTTGLMANTTAQLRLVADETATSFSSIETTVENFRKMVGKAAAGSTEAAAQLKLLGVDGSTAMYNIDGAFKTALETIIKTRDPVEYARKGVALFGNDFHKYKPFIDGFNGGLDESSRRAKALGLYMSGEGQQASKEYTKATADLDAAIQGLKNSLGTSFIDTLTAATNKMTEFVQVLQQAKWYEALGGAAGGALFAARQGEAPTQPKPATRDQIEGRPPTTPTSVPDPAAAAAALIEEERRALEALERYQTNVGAAIQYLQMKHAELLNVLTTTYNALEESFKKSGNEDAFSKAVDRLTTQYINKVTIIQNLLKTFEARKAETEKPKPTEYQTAVTEQAQQDRITKDTQAYVDIEKRKQATIDASREKSEKDYQRKLETNASRANELASEGARTQIALAKQAFDGKLANETAYVQKVNAIESKLLTDELSRQQKLLKDFAGNKEKEGEVVHRIGVLKEKIAQQEITNAERVEAVEKKIQDEKDRRQKSLDDFYQTLQDQFDAVSRGNRPLRVYEETLRTLERDYKDLQPLEKQRYLDLAAQTDALIELNKQHAELKDFFKSTLRYVFDGDFKGLLQNLGDRLKDTLADKLSDIFATAVLGFNPNATNNPVAKPIVKSIDKTNEILNSILVRMGGTPVMGASSGFSSILSSIGLGGGGGVFGGVGPGGTPPFNPSSSGGVGSHSGPVVTGGSQPGAPSSPTIRGIWNQITGPGGIFGSQGFGNNVGTYGGIGAIGNMVGGFIGGQVGGVISGAASGLALGAQIGSLVPGIGTAVGAAVGAIAGGLMGLLGGDPKRKQDKQENMPRLRQGFSDATEKLQQILADLRSLNGDPDALLSQAREVRSQMASGFGIQMLSKKYRKQASSLIAQQLAAVDREPDGLMAQIIAAAGIARGAADRSKRILPEFAGGVFIDPRIWHPNGLLPGVFDGRDDIVARLTKGEMVLNPDQQARARRRAGHDVFAGIGIPNYPNASPSAAMASGGIAGRSLSMPAMVVQPNFTLEISGVSMDDKVEAYLTGDNGMRTQINVIKKLKKRGDI